MIAEGDRVPGPFTLLDHNGEEVVLPRPGPTLLWWGMVNRPRPAGSVEEGRQKYHSHGHGPLHASTCTTCTKSVSDLLPEVMALDVEVYGANFREPERNHKYATKGMFTVPFLTATREVGEAFGVVRTQGPLRSTPENIAYYLEGDLVVKAWRVTSRHAFMATALETLKEVRHAGLRQGS